MGIKAEIPKLNMGVRFSLPAPRNIKASRVWAQYSMLVTGTKGAQLYIDTQKREQWSPAFFIALRVYAIKSLYRFGDLWYSVGMPERVFHFGSIKKGSPYPPQVTRTDRRIVGSRKAELFLGNNHHWKIRFLIF